MRKTFFEKNFCKNIFSARHIERIKNVALSACALESKIRRFAKKWTLGIRSNHMCACGKVVKQVYYWEKVLKKKSKIFSGFYVILRHVPQNACFLRCERSFWQPINFGNRSAVRWNKCTHFPSILETCLEPEFWSYTKCFKKEGCSCTYQLNDFAYLVILMHHNWSFLNHSFTSVGVLEPHTQKD